MDEKVFRSSSGTIPFSTRIKRIFEQRENTRDLIKLRLPIYNLQSMEFLSTAKKNSLGGNFSPRKWNTREKCLDPSSIRKKRITFTRAKELGLAAREMILNFSQYFFLYENTDNTLPPGCFVNCTQRNGLFDLRDQRRILESREEN